MLLIVPSNYESTFSTEVILRAYVSENNLVCLASRIFSFSLESFEIWFEYMIFINPKLNFQFNIATLPIKYSNLFNQSQSVIYDIYYQLEISESILGWN